MRLTQFRDFPSSTQVASYPDSSFAYFHVNIGAGERVVIKHGISGVAPTLPISELWLTGSKPIFSWSIQCATAPPHPGLSLFIETSWDGANVHDFNVYFIPISTVPFVMEGLFIPGYSVRFTLINASALVASGASGVIKQQGCE